MNKKGQTAGVVTGLVLGIAGLVVGVIIAFVVVSTMNNANLLTGTRPTLTVTNENLTLSSVNGNDTFVGFNTSWSDIKVLSIKNATTTGGAENYNFTVLVANATWSNATGQITNATSLVWNKTIMNYTYTIQSEEEMAAGRLSGNFSSGVDNVSAKLPTVLLVAAIVLILGILAVLVAVWQRMRLGGGGTSV